MPEGPEIKRAADQLARAIQGQPALLVEFAFPQLQSQALLLTGQLIQCVEPRGKAMLIHFANHRSIYSHNQLYGEWAILEHGEPPRTSVQLRIAIHTQRNIAVLYSASSIEVWPTVRIKEHPYIARLGVELLAVGITQKEVLAQINQPRFARKSVAGLLLDQGFLAGIGNYLRSEILFVARIHPDVRLSALSAAQRATLAKAAFDLTHQSYQTSGITNDLCIANRMKAAGDSFSRYRHWVFDRDGESCHVCCNAIRRIDVSGRGLYWCPHCQSQ